MGNVSQAFKDTIKSYLDSRAKEDELFAKSYANPNKNIDKCCDYIIQEVQKMNVKGLSDDEVYSLAVHYYDEDNLGEIKECSCKVVVNHTVELTEEEKAKAKAKAIADYEAKVRQELESSDKEKQKSESKTIPKSSPAKPTKKVQEMSIFDFLEEENETEN